jgi:hypothetical protein
MVRGSVSEEGRKYCLVIVIDIYGSVRPCRVERLTELVSVTSMMPIPRDRALERAEIRPSST